MDRAGHGLVMTTRMADEDDHSDEHESRDGEHHMHIVFVARILGEHEHQEAFRTVAFDMGQMEDGRDVEWLEMTFTSRGRGARSQRSYASIGCEAAAAAAM